MTENTGSTEAFRVVVFADFVCPYSFLAVDQFDRLAREYGIQPLWRTHWLHPDTPPEGSPGVRTPERVERLHAWIKDMSPAHYERVRIPSKRQYSFHAFEGSSSPTTAASTSLTRPPFTISCGPKDVISASPIP